MLGKKIDPSTVVLSENQVVPVEQETETPEEEPETEDEEDPLVETGEASELVVISYISPRAVKPLASAMGI